MNIQIKYFASIREIMNRSEEFIQTNSSTLESLQAELIAKGEPYALALSKGKAIRMALNQELVGIDALLHEGDEVAFFPPVTGG